ncbi:hypothetical protein M422DRAFT_261774 [Sphaerobolus stellatus SS14]|uniref:Unplaced genomic scaffold SPHSTscaffold_109, whole genome shotgun sequence n=1 Tax=Sphaerobolus stellatus (strain SS14) TaxID=990650 RepID=A0A0C9V2F6_SPHS4|nr:hypothetical protein M422DRAFT_261774 [Sphaerobolus stellatus SS14]
MGWDWGMAFQRYSDSWRKHRRAFHEKFHSGAVGIFKTSQIKHSRDLLRRLLVKPDDFAKHLRHVAGAIIMEVTYGIHIKPEDDPYIINADEASRGIGEAGVPGSFMVDRLPWLRHLPDWLPGMAFKEKARKWHKITTDMKELPYQYAKAEVDAGRADECFVSVHLEELTAKDKFSPEEEEVVKNAAGIAFTGGSDTTVSLMTTFILAMALHPEVQKKAQKELDSVLGGVRLVEFEDESELPYISAVVKETMRWHPLFPQSLAHAAVEEDVVGEYYIPKGSIVIGNSWRLLHNEEDFGPNTDRFIPERFLEKSAIRDPETTGSFGYGRRICPGMHMAQNLLFIEIASILQTFDISGPRDANGTELPMEYNMTSGIFSYPVDLKCSIVPRSNAAVQLIEESLKSIT